MHHISLTLTKAKEWPRAYCPNTYCGAGASSQKQGLCNDCPLLRLSINIFKVAKFSNQASEISE